MVLLSRSTTAEILLGLLLGAVAGGSVQALVTALTGDLVKPAQRGRAIGALHTIGDLGSALGPLSAYVLLSWIGLSGVYLLCAGLWAVGFMLTLALQNRTGDKPCDACQTRV